MIRNYTDHSSELIQTRTEWLRIKTDIPLVINLKVLDICCFFLCIHLIKSHLIKSAKSAVSLINLRLSMKMAKATEAKQIRL